MFCNIQLPPKSSMPNLQPSGREFDMLDLNREEHNFAATAGITIVTLSNFHVHFTRK